jgi:hypothetical protein
MARFNSSLSAHAAHAAHATGNVHVAARALAALAQGDAAGAGESPWGAGWFESSRDLVRGLEVMETAPGDAAYNDWVNALRG